MKTLEFATCYSNKKESTNLLYVNIVHYIKQFTLYFHWSRAVRFTQAQMMPSDGVIYFMLAKSFFDFRRV